MESSIRKSEHISEALDYTLEIFDISKEKKMLHIFHKINELIYLREKHNVLNELNKIHFAKYNDIIIKMEKYCELNKKRLYLCDNNTIKYNIMKCFKKCFNNIFVDNNKIYPMFKLNIKDFLNLYIYKCINSQDFQFFLFIYIEKFLYSFSLFSYKYCIKNLSEGVILYNFEDINTFDLNKISFYLLVRDINYIISIITPIYINTVIIYKSKNLKEKLYKIFKLIENKNCKTIFIEEKDDLLEITKLESAFTQHNIGKSKETNIFCYYYNFFLLNNIFDINNNDKENLEENFDLSDMLIKANMNFMKIQQQLKKKIKDKNSCNQKEKSSLNLCLSNLKIKNDKKKLNDKKRVDFLEDKIFSNVFNLKYFKDAANKYHEDALSKKEQERNIINFITQSNLHDGKIINKKIKDFNFGDMYIYHEKKEKKENKIKEKTFTDLDKIFRGNITTCIFRDNLNYVGYLDSILGELSKKYEY